MLINIFICSHKESITLIILVYCKTSIKVSRLSFESYLLR